MYQRSTVTMTMRALDRLQVIQAAVGGELHAGAAAECAGLSTRQIRRLTERCRLEGPVSLIWRLRNRPSNRRLQEPLENQSARILRDQYPDLGPTLAMEKLAERHQIVVAKETGRRIQVAAGLWIPRKLRTPKVQQPRTRRACVGEFVQINGCAHRWFEDRAPMCTALVFVDDATSRLMWIRFATNESTFTYFEAMREYLSRSGRPCPAAAPPPPTAHFQVTPPDCSTHALASSNPPRVQYLPWALLGKQAGDTWPTTRIVYVPTSIPSAGRWTSTSTSSNSSQRPVLGY